MSKINTEIGGRIRYFRNLRDKKQQELADATGKDICKIETGKQKIDIETLLTIAKVLNVELNELCNITRDKPEKPTEKTVLEQEYYQSMIECNLPPYTIIFLFFELNFVGICFILSKNSFSYISPQSSLDLLGSLNIFFLSQK